MKKVKKFKEFSKKSSTKKITEEKITKEEQEQINEMVNYHGNARFAVFFFGPVVRNTTAGKSQWLNGNLNRITPHHKLISSQVNYLKNGTEHIITVEIPGNNVNG